MQITNAEKNAIDRDRTLTFGRALGLDEDFVADAATRGASAVVDRLRVTGADPHLMQIVLLAQQVGTFLQRKRDNRERVTPTLIRNVVALLSKKQGIDPEDGLMLVGAAQEAMQHTSRILSRQTTEKGDAQRTGTD